MSLFLSVALQYLLGYTAYNDWPAMTSSMAASIRTELVGTWEMVDHVAYPLFNETDKRYPMGHDAKAIITYSSDGYMSAQFLLPQQQGLSGGSESDQQLAGSESFMAYAGEFYLDESEERRPVVMHRPRITNLPHLLNQIQKRAVNIVHEDAAIYLYLSTVETMDVSGDACILSVKWQKMPQNMAGSP